MLEVNIYPYNLGQLTEVIQAIVETDYMLTFGKRRKADGNYETFVKMEKRAYPFEIVGKELVDIKVYKKGEQATAKWDLSVDDNGIKTKTLYFFFGSSASYLSDQPKLPPSIENDFDSSEVSLTAGALKNPKNLYDTVAESGAYFDPNKTYRQFSFVKSSKNGKLYVRISEVPSEGSPAQLDPFDDNVNWKELIRNIDEEFNTKNYVDVVSKQDISGQKTFLQAPLKAAANTSPKSNEIVCFEEVKQKFLLKDEDAKNAKKLSDTEASDIGGVAVGKAVIVKTNSNGKIDDSFLNAKIVSNDQLVLNVVSTNNGDGVKTFNSIQEAFDYASKLIKLSPITIKVADGTYTKGGTAPVLNLTSIYDCSMISIIGNVNNPDRCIIKFSSSQQGLYFTGKGLFINGFKFNQFETSKGESVGLNIDHGASLIVGQATIVDSAKYGIVCTGGSHLEANNITVSNCDVSYNIDGATADVCFSESQSGKIGCLAENNAVVYARGCNFSKGNLQSPAVGFITRYGAVVRAEESRMDGLDSPYNNDESGVPNITNGIITYGAEDEEDVDGANQHAHA